MLTINEKAVLKALRDVKQGLTIQSVQFHTDIILEHLELTLMALETSGLVYKVTAPRGEVVWHAKEKSYGTQSIRGYTGAR